LSENGTVTLQYLDAGLEAGSGSTEGIEDSNFAADYGLTYACETASSVSNNTAFSFGVQAGIFLMPESVDAQGCAGVGQDHAFNVTSFAGYDTTIDLTYTILSGSGTCTGPASVAVSNSGSTPFVTTLTPVGAPGDLVVCRIDAADVQNPDFNDFAVINKTIVAGITEWQQIADEPNSGRMDNVTAGYNGLAWSITGYGADANVRTYDPSSNTWTVVGTPAPFGYNYARSGCQVNDVVFIYGDASTTGFTGLWKYDMGAPNALTS
jgi:hypothetical protein